MNIIKKRIKKTVIVIPEHSADAWGQEPDEETAQLYEIVKQYKQADYHGQITERKSWNAMYQLAESRSNIIEWLDIPPEAKVLELGAGCGAVTSVLLDKCSNVTCQEENIHYCRINASRQEEKELVIYAMPFEQCEALLEHDYDFIVLIGVLAVSQAAELLRQLKGHLKPQGKLVIAEENKFGLKYWAGNKENYTHKYFAGLENQTQQKGVHLYTRRGLKKLLTAAGFNLAQFYYPYPDHRFALDIYSDKYLPKMGDLSYNIANYEDDRIVLFDEQKVFDSIIEEGQFPLFSNSYLCIAAQNINQPAAQLRPELLYIRYASDRAPQFAIRTDMIGGEKRIVRKTALFPAGDAHVRHIGRAYRQLCGQYKDTDLKFNCCSIKTCGSTCGQRSAAEFEFIHGQALQAQVRELAAEHEIKKIFDILRRMMQYIRSDKNKQLFEMTEEFTKVFGDIPAGEFPEHLECSKISDIDLILPNILVDEKGIWNVIDYEWTFFFPIPQNYIIYRTLFFLNHENSDLEALSMDKLLAFAEITPREGELYAQMETGFQQYAAGGLVPYREMVNLLERRFWNIVQMEEGYDQAVAQNELLKGKGIWKIARKIKRVFHARRGLE